MKMNMNVIVTIIAAALNSIGVVYGGNLVVNGGFEGPYGDPNYHIKERFSEIKPYGWSGGDKLTYLSMPGADTIVDNNGGLAVWSSPGLSPVGGNVVMADGDPNYSSAIYQMLNNLVIGQQYHVGFYQAAGQNRDSTGATWEQWQVGFGDTKQLSQKMTTASKGTSPWEHQVLTFTADAKSEILSFLAVGGPGGGPPISFLDGVTASSVPEPSSLALFSAGLLGFGVMYRRRRMKASSLCHSASTQEN